MKKIAFVFAAIVAVSFASCKKANKTAEVEATEPETEVEATEAEEAEAPVVEEVVEEAAEEVAEEVAE